MTKQEKFFYDNGGCSYNPKTETMEQGKRRGAARLAAAETWACQEGLRYIWLPDDEGCAADATECSHADCQFCQLVDESGAVLQSLSGICGATMAYQRVVQAELALEQQARATGATITNLADLCDFFSADEPAQLNKHVYKATDCGASISLLLTPEAYAALGPVAVWEAWKCCDGREYQGQPHLRTNKDRAKVARQEAAGVARHKCPACGKTHTTRRTLQPLTIPARGPWIHSGDELRAKLTRDTPIVGFTIQTIVEGSEATVDSDTFSLPVTGAEIDGWIAQMEFEAASIFERANEDDDESDDEEGHTFTLPA